ncbi:MAG TPA: hypothetical protein VEH02_05600 [Pseudolabrys sp.]|nr:hypothetical protein [Pseudolabrys sp.]
MVAVTYGVAHSSAEAKGRSRAAARRKNIFVRFLDALAESRMQQVHREITRHAHLLPPQERGKWLP